MNSSVAAVIVTYNSANQVGPCLRAMEGLTEVVVVDNASSDETCRRVREAAPQARLIRNARNRGFAAAVNQGIQATTNPFVLLLNPDAVLRTGLESMVQECLAPEVGAAGGKLVDARGAVQAGFNVRALPTPLSLAAEVLGVNRLWPSNPVNHRYRCLDLDYGRAQEVEQPAGAFLMIRRDVLDEIGCLDEAFYPLWFEDVDLCLRIRAAGYVIRYVPDCVAEHRGAHSLQSIEIEERYLAWYGNLLRFTHKHFSASSGFLLRSVIWAGLLGRWVASFVRERRGDERKACRAVMRLIQTSRPFPNRGAEVSVNNTSTAES